MPTTATGLKQSAAIIGGFGVAMLLATLPPLDAGFALLADLAHWPLDGGQDMRDPGARLLLAIGGGIALGWGVLIWGLAGLAEGARAAAIRALVIRAYLVWFLADSAVSVVVGAWANVPGNVAFLALILWPLRQPAARTAQG
jgi:hypothetical protein